jgi:hypothetical protein
MPVEGHDLGEHHLLGHLLLQHPLGARLVGARRYLRQLGDHHDRSARRQVARRIGGAADQESLAADPAAQAGAQGPAQGDAERRVRHHRPAPDELDLADDLGDRRRILGGDEQVAAIFGQREDALRERELGRDAVEQIEGDDRSVEHDRGHPEVTRDDPGERLLVGQAEGVGERHQRHRSPLRDEELCELIGRRDAGVHEQRPQLCIPPPHPVKLTPSPRASAGMEGRGARWLNRFQ